MSNTCEIPFVTEEKTKKCKTIADVVTSRNAKVVAWLLKVNNDENGLDYNEECSINTIVNIIDKLNPNSASIITDDEKKYLLSFLDEAATKEKLKKVLTRYLSTIKDKDTFLSKTFFDKNKNLNLDDIISKFKEFINKYDNKKVEILHIGLYLPLDKEGLYIKGKNWVEKIYNEKYSSISFFMYNHYDSRWYLFRTEINWKKWLIVFNWDEKSISDDLNPTYDNMSINEWEIIITELDWKKWLLKYNFDTKKLEVIFKNEYDNFEIDYFANKITVELDWKKWYFEYKEWKLTTLLDFTWPVNRLAYNLWFKNKKK